MRGLAAGLGRAAGQPPLGVPGPARPPGPPGASKGVPQPSLAAGAALRQRALRGAHPAGPARGAPGWPSPRAGSRRSGLLGVAGLVGSRRGICWHQGPRPRPAPGSSGRPTRPSGRSRSIASARPPGARGADRLVEEAPEVVGGRFSLSLHRCCDMTHRMWPRTDPAHWSSWSPPLGRTSWRYQSTMSGTDFHRTLGHRAASRARSALVTLPVRMGSCMPSMRAIASVRGTPTTSVAVGQCCTVARRAPSTRATRSTRPTCCGWASRWSLCYARDRARNSAMVPVAQSRVLGALPCSLTLPRNRSPRHGLGGGRPGCSRSALAGAGGGLGQGHARPGGGSSALAGAGGRTPGRQSVPRLWPFCASRGGGEVTWQQGRPGCSRSALAGAGGRADRYMHAPAVAVLR